MPQSQTISKSTRRSCNICFTWCTRRDKSCDRTKCGCFTTTMLLFNTLSIHQFLVKGDIALPYWNNLIHLILLHVTSFPKAQENHKEELFWRHRGHQEGHDDRTEGHSRIILPAVKKKAWQSTLDLMGITLKRKPCNLLFGIKIIFLWP